METTLSGNEESGALKGAKTAAELLTALEGHKLFITTRGTTGDASGLLHIGREVIDTYEYADVCALSDLKNINIDAFEDCVDYIDNDPLLSTWSMDDFFVIYYDTDFVLAWEQV